MKATAGRINKIGSFTNLRNTKIVQFVPKESFNFLQIIGF